MVRDGVESAPSSKFQLQMKINYKIVSHDWWWRGREQEQGGGADIKWMVFGSG